MKSLFIMALLACSTLISPSGALADVITTKVSIVSEDNTNAAVIVNVAITDAVEKRGNFVSCVAVMLPATNGVALERKYDLSFATIGQADAISYLMKESWRPRYQDSNYRSLRIPKSNHAVSYRHARDGLSYQSENSTQYVVSDTNSDSASSRFARDGLSYA